ncbi:carbonic anhydrase [Halopelagius longus]|uniref:carbonic anhydrase n=1 Tax=Halopelagius longus TaxID=1236180 RepID=A0A1H1BTC4_9EURY|nr:carbonic anhydrase [Halopelagius longus]RDI70916.1 carbonic anhydrase [Halopelagius longus]SDQ55194.1 carbonic anhydrase [Halopelagius longus]
MGTKGLERLLEGNERHVRGIPGDYFSQLRGAQNPGVVAVSCSDSRVPAEGAWGVEEAGELFTSVNVGNQAWTDVDGELVANDAVGYAVDSLDVDDAVVLGHTGCGAVTAAYQAVNGEGGDVLPGVEQAISRLVPYVEEANEAGVYDEETEASEAVNRLVEYLVREQVAFLVESDAVPEDVTVSGFVYDFQRAYGGDDGAAYLVAADGDTDGDALRERVPEEYENRVRSLL